MVLADAAAPTDYESTVVSITPPTDTIDVEVIGGDSFVQLTVAPGTEVLIEGYQQEPYLRFRTDGVVEENQRAPTTYLNASRLGGGEVPAGADPALPPDWKQVATGGTFAWHDHRSHWMDPNPPADHAPGDVVQSPTLAMTVDAVPVEVVFAVTWLPAPSRLPLAVGAAVGGALVLLTLFWRRRLAWPLLVVAVAALGIGWWQFSSLPAVTGPLLVWWLLPAVAARLAADRARARPAAAVVRAGPAGRPGAGRLDLHPPRRRVPRPHPDRRPVLARPWGHGRHRRRHRRRRHRRRGGDVAHPRRR